jgi:hypothetical protein
MVLLWINSANMRRILVILDYVSDQTSPLHVSFGLATDLPWEFLEESGLRRRLNQATACSASHQLTS